MTTALIPVSCWSVEQKPIVEFIAQSLAKEIARLMGQVKAYHTEGTWRVAYRKQVAKLVKDHVALYGFRLQDIDARPVYLDNLEDVWAGKTFFRYTQQGLLEEVITECEKLGVYADIIKMLQAAV